MGELNKVVVRFLDGKVLKATTQDFFPNRAAFHLLPTEGGNGIEVRCKQLKAVFFVKEFVGNSARKDLQGFIAGPGETSQGKKIAVLFKDAALRRTSQVRLAPAPILRMGTRRSALHVDLFEQPGQ